jgi:hypothetical protein
MKDPKVTVYKKRYHPGYERMQFKKAIVEDWCDGVLLSEKKNWTEFKKVISRNA